MAEEPQAGEKRLLKQRDAQHQLQEPLRSRETLTGELALNEVNNWGALARGNHKCHRSEMVDM